MQYCLEHNHIVVLNWSDKERFRDQIESFLRYHHVRQKGGKGNAIVDCPTMRGWGEQLIRMFCIFNNRRFVRKTRHNPGTILQFFRPEHPNGTLDDVCRDAYAHLDLYRRKPCRTPCRASTLLTIWKRRLPIMLKTAGKLCRYDRILCNCVIVYYSHNVRDYDALTIRKVRTREVLLLTICVVQF